MHSTTLKFYLKIEKYFEKNFRILFPKDIWNQITFEEANQATKIELIEEKSEDAQPKKKGRKPKKTNEEIEDKQIIPIKTREFINDSNNPNNLDKISLVCKACDTIVTLLLRNLSKKMYKWKIIFPNDHCAPHELCLICFPTNKNKPPFKSDTVIETITEIPLKPNNTVIMNRNQHNKYLKYKQYFENDDNFIFMNQEDYVKNEKTIICVCVNCNNTIEFNKKSISIFLNKRLKSNPEETSAPKEVCIFCFPTANSNFGKRGCFKNQTNKLEHNFTVSTTEEEFIKYKRATTVIFFCKKENHENKLTFKHLCEKFNSFGILKGFNAHENFCIGCAEKNRTAVDACTIEIQENNDFISDIKILTGHEITKINDNLVSYKCGNCDNVVEDVGRYSLLNNNGSCLKCKETISDDSDKNLLSYKNTCLLFQQYKSALLWSEIEFNNNFKNNFQKLPCFCQFCKNRTELTKQQLIHNEGCNLNNCFRTKDEMIKSLKEENAYLRREILMLKETSTMDKNNK